MKYSHLIPARLFCLGLFATISAQEVQPRNLGQPNAPVASAPRTTVSAPTPPVAAPRFSDEQIIEYIGWFVGKRMNLGELGFSGEQVNLLAKGLMESEAGTQPPYDPQKIGPQMNVFMQKKQAAFRIKRRDENLAAAKAFFEKLKENQSVVELPSGLRYEILKPGQGAYPTATDTVKVYYTGKLLNDTVFDHTLRPGRPMETRLNRVIPGWTEGLQKINQGGEVRLYIPSQLAYGDGGTPNIPPGSALIFDVELIEVKPAPPAPIVPAAPASAVPATPKH
jgi:FKBP-type peptidyl-prolyl cis-trans isomerase